MKPRRNKVLVSERSGLQFSLHHLDAGTAFFVPADERERLVVVMGGQCQITVDGRNWHAVGRRQTVFFGAPYVAYSPRGSELRISNESGMPCEIALVSVPAVRRCKSWLATADQIVASLNDAFSSREIAVSGGIMLAEAGVNTDRMHVGERMVSPGTGVSIPLQLPWAKRPWSGRRAIDHIVHYRLFPTVSRAYQWTMVDEAARHETRTVHDGDFFVLSPGISAAIALPGTYVYYLWAAAVEARDEIGNRRVVYAGGSERSFAKRAGGDRCRCVASDDNHHHGAGRRGTCGIPGRRD